MEMHGPEHSAWIRSLGVRVPLRSTHFSILNFGTFTWTSVCESRMNGAARALLTFQMLTLLPKYLYRQSQYWNTWDSKCLALIAQVFRAFGMIPKDGGSNQVETFSVFNTSTLPQESQLVSHKWMLLSAHTYHFKWQLCLIVSIHNAHETFSHLVPHTS